MLTGSSIDVMCSTGKQGNCMGQLHLFGTKTQLEILTKLGDPLTKANQLIDWEIFRKPIEDAIRKDLTKGGRPPYDAILMYKITCCNNGTD